MLMIVKVVRSPRKWIGPDVTTTLEGKPNCVALVAYKRNKPVPATVTVVPSGENVSVPGPEAFTVTDLPVSRFVTVANREPVITYTVDPSGSVDTVAYSLSTGYAI